MVSGAIELADIYREHLSEVALTPENILEQLRVPPRIKKQRMIEALVQSTLGISYDEFRNSDDNKIDASVRNKLWSAIHDMTLGVELIITGFLEEKLPLIFRLAWDEVERCSPFACIGSGTSAAEHSLYRRKQLWWMGVWPTIYHIWEAKKFGELSPTVGQMTYLFIVKPDAKEGARCEIIPDVPMYQFLDEQYALYGPQAVPDAAPGINQEIYFRDHGLVG